MQPRHPLVGHIFGHVLGQVSRRPPCLLQRPRANRKITDQLDVHDPSPPDLADQRLAHVAPNREVDVEAVPARMPLRCPGVRQRLAPKLAPHPLEELGHVRAQLLIIEAAPARVRQRREAIQPVRADVTPKLRPRAPRRFLLRALDIRRPAPDRWTPQRRLEAAATLTRLRVEGERPARLLCGYHT
jgi:hypothetical protein